MTAHEWHVLGAFGLLAAALALVDSKAALYMVGTATVVVLVRNSRKVTEVLA